MRRLLDHMVQHPRAQDIDLRRRDCPALLGPVGPKPVAQNGKARMSAALRRLATSLSVEALRLEEIRVHETGEQHADQKGLAEALVCRVQREVGRRSKR